MWKNENGKKKKRKEEMIWKGNERGELHDPTLKLKKNKNLINMNHNEL